MILVFKEWRDNSNNRCRIKAVWINVRAQIIKHETVEAANKLAHLLEKDLGYLDLSYDQVETKNRKL